MALNDVKFQVLQGGLGRVAEGEDHVSALMFAAAAPTAFGTAKCKAFNDLELVKADGIVAGHATYGEAYYHAKEFFRIAPGATLWLCFSATYLEMNTAAAGKIRQVGVFFTTFSDLTTVHQAGVTALTALHAPLVVIAGSANTAALTLSSVADQNVNTAPQVAVLLAGDGDGDGAALATALGKVYIPAVGAAIGALAAASVHENIGWVAKFNVSDGKSLEVIRLADGSNNPAESVLDALNTKRYVVLRKHTGIGGTYFQDTHTAIDSQNDYAQLELNRTMQKARRVIRKALLPQLNSPLTVDAATGKLAPGSIKYFEALTNEPLNTMQAAGEFSGYATFISPDQNVLATSTLNISVKIVPRGVARHIQVNIGFAVTASF